MFTAGMAVFAHPGWWARHRAFVHAFEWLAPLALVPALVGRAPRAVVALAAGAVALLAAQYATAHLRLAPNGQGWAAVHPVSAVLLFWTATELARRAARLASVADRDRDGAPRASARPSESYGGGDAR